MQDVIVQDDVVQMAQLLKRGQGERLADHHTGQANNK